MLAKSSMPNASRLLFMMLFSAVLFNSLHVNAEDKKKFEINKNHTSAKAIVSEKKEFNATVEFDPADYSDNKDFKFNLTVGGCKFAVIASKDQNSDAIDFKFYNEKGPLDTVLNPKSFLVQEQSLIFVNSNGITSNFSSACNDGFKFNPIEGQDNFTLEISLEGNIPDGLVLKADNLIYDESENEKNAMLWVWISVGVGSFLLIAVIVAIGVGICIKNRKKKINTKNKPDAIAMVTPSAEESKMPVAQNVSVEQKPTSDSKPSISTTKTSEPPQAKKQISVVEVAKKPKANDPKAKNGQLEKTQKAKNDKTSKKVSKKKEASLKTAVEIKPKVETKPAPIKQVEKLPTPMRKSVTEFKPDKKKNSKTKAKVKAKASVQEPVRSRIYHRPEDEGSEQLSDVEKPDKISPSVSVKTPTLSKDSKTRSKNSSTTECTSNTKTTLEESTAKSMDSTQESSKRSTLKSLDSTQETSSKRSITGSRTID